MNTWVQKSRFMLKRGRKGWHCKSYLDGLDGDPQQRYPSGGRDSTKSPQSMAYIRRIQPGDLILLFQVDDDAIYAFAEADSAGMEADRGSRQFNLFYLKPAAEALRLHKPLTLEELRATGCDPACFGPGTRGRIFPVTTEELVGIIQAAVKANPDQAEELSGWLRERSRR